MPKDFFTRISTKKERPHKRLVKGFKFFLKSRKSKSNNMIGSNVKNFLGTKNQS